MTRIKTLVLCLNKTIYYDCNNNTQFEEYYKYIYKLIMGFESNDDGNTLAYAFRFIKDGEEQYARFDYGMLDFFSNFHYDLNNIVLDFDEGYGRGACADVQDFIRIRLNSNEGKHRDAPHVHVSRAYKNKPYCRIHLKTLTPMKGDEKKWMDIFNNSERNKIIECIKLNKSSLIEQYYKIVNGEYIEKEYTIIYDGKEYIIG